MVCCPERLRRGCAIGSPGLALLSAGPRRKLQHTFIGRDRGVESLYLDNFYSAFSGAADRRNISTARGRLALRWLPAVLEHRRGYSPLRRMLYADQKTYLVELLMEQDQMSMAARSRAASVPRPSVCRVRLARAASR